MRRKLGNVRKAPERLVRKIVEHKENLRKLERKPGKCTMETIAKIQIQ